MGNRTKKAILFMAGQVGAGLLSIVAFCSVLSVFDQDYFCSYQIIGSLVLLRLLNQILRKPKPALITRSISMRIRRVMEDELMIMLGLFATVYVIGWPISRQAILIYAAANLLLQVGLMIVTRKLMVVMAHNIRLSGNAVYEKQTIILGTGKQAKRVADIILDSPEMETLLIGFLDFDRKGLYRYRDVPLLGDPDQLQKIIASCQIDALIIAVEPEDLHRSRKIFEVAEKMGVTICLMPEIFSPELARVRPGYLQGLPTLMYNAIPECRTRLFAKNVIDRFGAMVGILFFAPLMALCAIAIKIESSGPVFFRQVRSGLNGKPFMLMKFRTMCIGAEAQKEKLNSQNEMSGPVFKIKNDPRVTRVGCVLRKYSLDEFPQFFNVLLGEMSLVGPRPPLPKEVVEYEPWQHRKLSVKPGVTCLWQVNGRNHVDFEEWMKLDLEYIDNWSLWEDTKIIARTVPAVLKTDGAS